MTVVGYTVYVQICGVVALFLQSGPSLGIRSGGVLNVNNVCGDGFLSHRREREVTSGRSPSFRRSAH